MLLFARLAGHNDFDDFSKTVFSDVEYAWDDAGNLESLTNTPSGDAGIGLGAEKQCFEYNDLRQLMSATSGATTCDGSSGPAGYAQTFTYDTKTGNRLSAVTTGAGASSLNVTDWDVHAPKAITIDGQQHELTWDAAGRLTNWAKPTGDVSMQWDALGRLAQATNTDGSATSNVYSADGDLGVPPCTECLGE